MANDVAMHSENLKQALDLAKIKRGFCAPNPAVGAVIVNKEGKLISSGHHHGPGFPHAEIEAFKNCQDEISGATLYVTLEPCCHWGRTPPCTEAIIHSGVKRVIYGYHDPNPIISGKGAQQLQAAGINCIHFPLPEIDNFYRSYSYWHVYKRPTLTAKLAISFDGKIAHSDGQPLKISSDPINEITHQLRYRSDAILTTAKTICADNPRLDVRINKQNLKKDVFILDSLLITPIDSLIFRTAKKVIFFHSKEVAATKINELIALGAECISISKTDDELDLNEVVDVIGSRGIHDLWIEAGGKCFSAFLNQKMLQRAIIYVSPKWVGFGRNAFSEMDSFDFSNYHVKWQHFGSDAFCEVIF